MGSAEFQRMVKEMDRSFADYLEQIRDLPVGIDRWQVEKLALAGVQNELYYYAPGLTAEQLGPLASRWFDDLDKAIAAVLGELPAGARVAMVPEGPYTFARAAAPVC
jgi:hypothetical protein